MVARFMTTSTSFRLHSVRWFVVLVVSLCATRALAQDHECSDTRSACETSMLAQCPAGADVIDEQSLPPGPQQAPRYQLIFRCRPGTVEKAPSPVLAPENAYSPLRLSLRIELEQVRDTLLDLETTPPRYGGPIAMLAVGLPLAAVFTPVAIIAARDLLNYDPQTESDDLFGNKSWKRLSLGVFGTLSLLSLGLTTGGTVWLVKRVHAHRARQRQSEILRTRERELERQLDLTFDPVGQRLMLVGRF
jgi:hypothetical protein